MASGFLVAVIVCVALVGCGCGGSSTTGGAAAAGFNKPIFEKNGHLIHSCARIYGRYKAERERESEPYGKKSEFQCIR